MAIIITDQNFDSTIADNQLTVVDFFATWCGPCKKIGPYVAELAEEYQGKVAIGKCDVDNNMELAARFNIRTIPTLLFFKNGEVVNKHIGGASKEELNALVQQLIAG